MSKRTKQKLQITQLEDRTTPAVTPFQLDPSFGSAGQTYITPDLVPNTIYGTPRDAAIRPDGKIWVLGTLNGGSILARFNPNGSLDTSFDGDGLKSIVPWSETTSGLYLTKLELTQDGGVILGGNVTITKDATAPSLSIWPGPYNTNIDFVAIKVTSNGSYDAAFGDGGHAVVGVDTPDQSTQEALLGMGVTTDGKIVLSGHTNQYYFGFGGQPIVADATNPTSIPPYPGSASKLAIVRLTADGQLDTTFSDDGKTTIVPPVEPTRATFMSADVDSNGVVVFGGTRQSYDYYTNTLIIIVGPSIPPSPQELLAVVARVTVDGQLDTTFDGDGYAETVVRKTTSDPSPYYGAPYAYSQWVGIQPNGQIVVGTTISSPVYPFGSPSNEFGLVRFGTDGTRDTVFGTDGLQTVKLSQQDTPYIQDNIDSVSFQPDGSLFVTVQTPRPYPIYPVYGYIADPAANTVPAPTIPSTTPPSTTLYRFTTDGDPDTRLSPDGKLLLPQTTKGSSLQGFEVLVDRSGRLVITGQTESTTAQGSRIGLMRLTQQTSVNPSGPLVLTGTDGSSQQFATDATGKLMPNGVSTPASSSGHSRSIRADVDGDGFTDTIYFDGPGGGSNVVVVRGVDPGNPVQAAVFLNFNAYEESYKGGIYLAAADLDGDGGAELIVSPDAGGGARIEVFKLKGLQFVQLDNFIAFDDTEFRGGAHVATGDVNGDGTPDLVVSAGVGGGPRVAVYDGKGMMSMASSPRRLMGDFFAYDDANSVNLRNGVSVSVADLNGDGKADLVFGAGVGGGPRVYALDAAMLNSSGVATAQANPLANFFCSDPNGRGGINLVVKQASDNTPYLAVTGGDWLGKVYVYRSQDFLTSPTSAPAVFQQIELPGNTLQGVYVG